jgi:hypothetical protein
MAPLANCAENGHVARTGHCHGGTRIQRRDGSFDNSPGWMRTQEGVAEWTAGYRRMALDATSGGLTRAY